MRLNVRLRSLAFLVATLLAVSVLAQTSISTEGAIESQSGGFVFPDGSVQTTAATLGLAPVEDTGQQICWTASGVQIPCSGTGQDGELQLGVDWPTPRFTDNGDGTVTDNLTHLIWLTHANCFGATTWETALSDANGLMSGECSLSDGSVATDWRLPNIKELLSLVDYGASTPALVTGHPFTNVHSSFYWSSSSNIAGPSFAWGVDMSVGFGQTTTKSGAGFVWPVRGGH